MQSTQPSAQQLQKQKNKLGPTETPSIRLPAPEGVIGRGTALGSWGKANISVEGKHLNLLHRARCQGLPVMVVVVVLVVVMFLLSVPLSVNSAKTLNPSSPTTPTLYFSVRFAILMGG